MLGMDTKRTHDNPPTYIDLKDGVRIAYRRIGEGPDVLLVHGWPLHSATWRNIVPSFRRHFTCHLIDLPGSGATEWGDRTKITLSANRDALRQIVDALNLQRYAFVAHDSGGIFPRYLAAEDTNRVAGLVLGNTDIPGHRPLLLQLFILTLRLPGGMNLFPTLLRSSLIRRSWLLGQSVLYDRNLVDGDFYQLFLAPLLKDRRKMRGMLKLVRDWEWSVVDDLTNAHAKIQAPVQLIWAAEDPIFPLCKAKKMMTQFPNGVELQVVSKAKLYVEEEHPQTFADHAVPFLKRCFSHRQIS